MSDVLSRFRDAMRAVGLEPPEIIRPGRFHRFPGMGKRPGNTAGWCLLFEDGRGGCFGDWSRGRQWTWQAGGRAAPCGPCCPIRTAATIDRDRQADGNARGNAPARGRQTCCRDLAQLRAGAIRSSLSGAQGDTATRRLNPRGPADLAGRGF